MTAMLATALVTTTFTPSVDASVRNVKDVSERYREADDFTLSFIHTNDTHAHLDSVAKRVTAVKEVRANKPDALLVDAGDVFSGTLYFNEFKGQADLAFLNAMKYDVATLGNHEFGLGSSPEGHKALAEFIKGASFAFLPLPPSDVSSTRIREQIQRGEKTSCSTSDGILSGLSHEENQRGYLVERDRQAGGTHCCHE